METLFPFRNAELLFALLIPAALLAYVWTGRGERLVLPIDHGTTPRGRWLAALVRCAESLPALLLGVVILILAGPQRWDEPKSKKVLTNIEFCVDVSGSMSASFGEGNRYDAAMGAINDFLDYRDGDAFGLTFFGTEVLHWVPLTSDTSAFRCAPPFMVPSKLPRWFNGTSIGKALLACRRVLVEREEGDRMIILVSDGYSSDLGGTRAEEIASTLVSEGVVVNAVHIANSEPPDEIVRITAATGGEIFNPGDRAALEGVFHRIDEMQETRVEKVQAESVDQYAPWALAGIGLLVAALVSLLGLRATPW